MKHCEKCKIDVRGNDILCPLCQSRLTGNGEDSTYPEIPTIYIQHKLFFKLLISITVSAGVICVAVNLMTPHIDFWSIYVVFGILCFWISLVGVLKRRGNLFKNITFQVLALSLICIALDLFMGWTGWSLNYFLPIACSVAMLSLAVIAKVRKLPPEDYLVYIISDILFCIVPTVFFFIGLISVVIPTILCMTFSVITLMWLIVFEGKNLWLEINKRFHV